jgi:hypothetical protein
MAKAYFAGFHCCENASAEVATPWSANPAALASAATCKKGIAGAFITQLVNFVPPSQGSGEVGTTLIFVEKHSIF